MYVLFCFGPPAEQNTLRRGKKGKMITQKHLTHNFVQEIIYQKSRIVVNNDLISLRLQNNLVLKIFYIGEMSLF